MVTVRCASASLRPVPRDDGAYYQAVVDAAESFSAENGFGEVIVVDNIQSADAATELENLAQQPVDILIVGASEIAEPMPDLAEKYSDIFWYCNCGAGFPESEFYLQSQDNGAGIAYTAGVATGILLRDTGGDAVTMIGCCDLGFEIQHRLAFELGLDSVDPNFVFTYVPSGDFPFDFDNIQNATAAYETAVAEGADAIYPYLGGAHEPVVQLANEGGQIVLSAGASDVCTREGDLSWDIAVRFDGGDYVREIFPQILDGSARGRGHHRLLAGRGARRRRCGHLRRHARAAGRDGRRLRTGCKRGPRCTVRRDRRRGVRWRVTDATS